MSLLEQIFIGVCILLLLANGYVHYKLVACKTSVTKAAATTAAAAASTSEKMSNPLVSSFAQSLLNKESDSAKNAQGITMDDIGLANLLNGGVASSQW
jgi:hypothetical protein